MANNVTDKYKQEFENIPNKLERGAETLDKSIPGAKDNYDTIASVASDITSDATRKLPQTSTVTQKGLAVGNTLSNLGTELGFDTVASQFGVDYSTKELKRASVNIRGGKVGVPFKNNPFGIKYVVLKKLFQDKQTNQIIKALSSGKWGEIDKDNNLWILDKVNTSIPQVLIDSVAVEVANNICNITKSYSDINEITNMLRTNNDFINGVRAILKKLVNKPMNTSAYKNHPLTDLKNQYTKLLNEYIEGAKDVSSHSSDFEYEEQRSTISAEKRAEESARDANSRNHDIYSGKTRQERPRRMRYEKFDNILSSTLSLLESGDIEQINKETEQIAAAAASQATPTQTTPTPPSTPNTTAALDAAVAKLQFPDDVDYTTNNKGPTRNIQAFPNSKVDAGLVTPNPFRAGGNWDANKYKQESDAQDNIAKNLGFTPGTFSGAGLINAAGPSDETSGTDYSKIPEEEFKKTYGPGTTFRKKYDSIFGATPNIQDSSTINTSTTATSAPATTSTPTKTTSAPTKTTSAPTK